MVQMELKEKKKRSFVAMATSIVGILLVFAFFWAYQLHRAETGRSNYLPHALRRSLASRELQVAKSAEYESIRLRAFTKVASLDGDDFPDAWSYLCDFYSRLDEWIAAEISCGHLVRASGATAGNLGKLAWTQENLEAYAAAGETYARAADLDPADPKLRERAIWMFLAAHSYDRALASARKLIAYGRNVDEEEAYATLGFAYAQLGNEAQADAAYAIGFSGLRKSSCSLERAHSLWALACSGVSKESGRSVSNCVGPGCD